MTASRQERLRYEEAWLDARERWGRSSAYRIGLVEGERDGPHPAFAFKGARWCRLYLAGIADARAPLGQSNTLAETS